MSRRPFENTSGRNLRGQLRRLAAALALSAVLSPLASVASLPPGLWLGDVNVDAVSEIVPSRPAEQNSGTPVPSEGTLPMRMILHSDGNGNVHLLKWVTLMARQVENSDGEPSFEEILVTRKSVFFEADVVGRFPDGGERRGLRFFTTAYDWNGSDSAEGNQLLLIGSGQTMSGTLVLDAQHPANPFYHRFHNMHQKGRSVTREVEVTLDPASENGGGGIGGPDRVSGTYTEKLYGLNGPLSNPAQPQADDPHIALGGAFELHRVSRVPALNGN